MAIYVGPTKAKNFYVGGTKVKKIYRGPTLVYSAGNVAHYYVDGVLRHSQEYDEGQSVLSPSYSVPAKSGWYFAGWSNVSAASAPLSSLVMGSAPITLHAVYKGNSFTWISGYVGSAFPLNVSRWGWVRNTGISQTNTVNNSSDLGEVARRLKNGVDDYQYDACGFQSGLSGATSRRTRIMTITYGIYSPAGNGNYNGPGVLYVNANGSRIYTLDLTGKQVINGSVVDVALPDTDASIVVGMNGAVDAGSNQTPSGNISSITFSS